jgi:hypothetical protein
MYESIRSLSDVAWQEYRQKSGKGETCEQKTAGGAQRTPIND